MTVICCLLVIDWTGGGRKQVLITGVSHSASLGSAAEASIIEFSVVAAGCHAASLRLTQVQHGADLRR